jgi:hypothetical protein
MGFLKCISIILLLAPVSYAAGPPMLDGIELSTQGSLGTERTDFYGFSGDLIFGSILDPQNHMGDFHLSYTNYLEPSDPSTDASPLKSVIYWAGGFSVVPWNQGSFGLDLDSNYDAFEGLYTTGIRISLGQGPVGLSYRNARIALQTTPSSYTNPVTGVKGKDIGAFIYQQTVEVSGRFHPRKSTTIFSSVSYAWYNPNASELTNLLSQSALISLSNLQDALDNFELWSVSIGWREKITKKWDLRLSQAISNLIVAANPYLVSNAAIGYHWTPEYYTGLSYQYIYTPLSDTSNILLELRWNWDRKEF